MRQSQPLRRQGSIDLRARHIMMSKIAGNDTAKEKRRVTSLSCIER
jgi:hypothetical protein